MEIGCSSSAIECILVGLDQPAMWLLEKALKWLDAERNADAPVFYNTAQCKWLLSGTHDEASLRQSTALHDMDRHIENWDADTVELALPYWLESGEFEKACEIFEETPGTKRPTNINEIAREGSMAYVVCLQRLGRQYTKDEVDIAIDCYFRRSVPDLLSRGHAQNVARWMKIIFWDGTGTREAAWKTILRAYDFLPGVECPKCELEM